MIKASFMRHALASSHENPENSKNQFLGYINVAEKCPPNHSTLQWHPATPPKLVVTPQHSTMGTLQWHPAMAPRPLPQSWSSPPNHSPPPQHSTMAPYNGTQQWHHVHSPKVGRHPPTIAPHHSTLQWHPTMAPSNGTTSTPRKVGRHPPTIAHYNGTLQWHPAMAPRPLHPPIRQSGSSPSPLLEVRTPIAIAIWGKIKPLPRLSCATRTQIKKKQFR